jgi:Cu-Zn family superoxide dismutase
MVRILSRAALFAALAATPLAFAQAAKPATPPPGQAAAAASPKTMQVTLKSAKGHKVGTVKLTQTPHGVLLQGDLTHFGAGVHAIHLHSVGKCEGPKFTSAGGHFNPASKQHGYLSAEGEHAGDLPNLVVPASGTLHFELIAPDVSLEPGPNSLLDADGSAIVVHAKRDDYKSQPAGDAGDRVACGVVKK